MGLLTVAAFSMMLAAPPQGFVDVAEAIPDVQVDARYYGSDNFLGRPVKGYNAAKAFLSKEAASALTKVQEELVAKGLALKVFDGYRPQRAVDDFMHWIADKSDIKTKAKYYPNISKSQLVPQGYIAEKSGHTRGSTVDLTIVKLSDGAELDMGSGWDYLGSISHALTGQVSDEAKKNRALLRNLMIKHGFKPYDEEWWHFSLASEPYPNTYFDFVIE